MIGVLLLSASMLSIMLIFCIVFIVNARHWYVQRDKETIERFEQLSERITETNNIFKNNIQSIMDKMEKLLN